jgi:hypothetical protein
MLAPIVTLRGKLIFQPPIIPHGKTKNTPPRKICLPVVMANSRKRKNLEMMGVRAKEVKFPF